jgi:hypothetical protein
MSNSRIHVTKRELRQQHVLAASLNAVKNHISFFKLTLSYTFLIKLQSFIPKNHVIA